MQASKQAIKSKFIGYPEVKNLKKKYSKIKRRSKGASKEFSMTMSNHLIMHVSVSKSQQTGLFIYYTTANDKLNPIIILLTLDNHDLFSFRPNQPIHLYEC